MSIRQQRTNYLRQTTATSQTETLLMMNWVVESISGAVLQLRLYGPREGIVVQGVPPILPLNSGVAPESAEVFEGPSPDQYSQVLIQYDGPLLPADVFTLDQPTNAIRNRWGGQMASSVQAFPVPGVTSQDIFFSVTSWGGNRVIMGLSGAFAPYAIGPGLNMENVTKAEASAQAFWDTGELTFEFPSALDIGDELAWASSDSLVKGQWGGNLIGGSTFLS